MFNITLSSATGTTQISKGLPTAVLPQGLLIHYLRGTYYVPDTVMGAEIWPHSWGNSCLCGAYLQVRETGNEQRNKYTYIQYSARVIRAIKKKKQSEGIKRNESCYFDREVKEVLSERVTFKQRSAGRGQANQQRSERGVS